MSNELRPIEQASPVGADKATLSGVDEMYAALNTEVSCLNLLAFHETATTLSGAGRQITEWQVGAKDKVKLPYAEQRKNGERLARFKLLTRGCISIGKDGLPYSYTDRGLVGIALAGHNLWLADEHDIALSDVYGSKVRRINDEIDDSEPKFSGPFFRVLALHAIKKATDDAKNPIKLGDFPNLAHIADVDMAPEIMIGHVESLADAEVLRNRPVQKFENGMPVLRKYVSIRNVELAQDVMDIATSITQIDDNWVDFVQLGYEKAREITSDPKKVASLLQNRQGNTQPTYQQSHEYMCDLAISMSQTEGFSNGDFRRALGGTHDTYYISNKLTRMVNEGVIRVIGTDGSNRRIFGVANKNDASS